MGALRSVIEELRAEDVDSLPVEQIADDVVELRRVLDWLEVEWVRRVAAFGDKNGIDLEGHSSVTAFLKHRCRMTSSRAHRAVTLAHRLPELPVVNQAFGSGDLSLDQVRVLADVPERLHQELGRHEATLTEAVGPLSVADTRRVLAYWRSAVDGPGCDATADELFERRYVYASRTWAGMVKIDALLDPVAGETVLTALDAATPPRVVDDPRTASQRRADALADLARSFLDSGEASGSEKPHVMVLTDVAALQNKPGGLHETATGQVLSTETARQVACDATLSRIVFGPESEPVDVGRATRVIGPALRRALIARDRHCQFSGCDRPHRWTDAHHIWHWADGGPTALWNLKLLCRYHHTLEHRRCQRPP